MAASEHRQNRMCCGVFPVCNGYQRWFKKGQPVEWKQGHGRSTKTWLVWSDPTEELLQHKLQKILLLLWYRGTSTQCIAACWVAAHWLECTCWTLHCQKHLQWAYPFYTLIYPVEGRERVEIHTRQKAIPSQRQTVIISDHTYNQFRNTN